VHACVVWETELIVYPCYSDFLTLW
jgi:hypothetical protein